VPAAQLVHAVATAEARNWPAAHFLHWSEIAPVLGRKVPSAHLTQRVWPATDWKVPVPHGAHAVEGAAENWPAGHGEQDVLPAAEVVAPALHGLQLFWPPAVWKLPRGQLAHQG
jgi:hypothetical protein